MLSFCNYDDVLDYVATHTNAEQHLRFNRMIDNLVNQVTALSQNTLDRLDVLDRLGVAGTYAIYEEAMR